MSTYLNSRERELLLGSGEDHTLLAWSAGEAKAEPRFEAKRMSLCGDSFWMGHFAAVPALGAAGQVWTPVRSGIGSQPFLAPCAGQCWGDLLRPEYITPGRAAFQTCEPHRV